MFRIGEFSRIGSVTIDTLRHYDALGLLKPAQVDPFTGYRQYTAVQLASLNQIIALKEVGLSLEEIARILHDDLNTDELRGMLKAQLVVTESSIESAQLRRERILARLQYLDLENNMPTYEITLKSVEAHTIAGIRETVLTTEQMPLHLREKFQTIANWMIANKLPIGPPMTIYHDESYTQENIDTECAFIINSKEMAGVSPPDGGATPASPIVIRRIETVPQVATTIVAGGNSENFKLAYNTLGQWIGEHGYCIAGPPRELYYGSPEQGNYTAEIQFPVEKID